MLVLTLVFAQIVGDVQNAWAGGAGAPGSRQGGDQPMLSWVVKERTSGWDFETEERREQYRGLATQYIRLKKKQLPVQERERITAACEDSGTTQELGFCGALSKEPTSGKSRKLARERARKRAKVQELRRAFRSRKWETLAQASEPELSAALRVFEKNKELLQWGSAVRDLEGCQGSALPVALAMKMEKLFPEEGARALSRALYEKTVRCGSDGPAVVAFYRMGLLSIWDEKLPEADQFLAQVVDHPLAQDYRLRALYWRFYIAQSRKDRSSIREHRDRLIKEYPLSLHGLLISSDNLFGDLPIVNSKEPQVLYRTRQDPAINAQVLAAEALQSLGAFDRSMDVLDPLVDQIGQTEVAFQLYVSVLLMRAGDSIRKFGLLASLFRENPSLISTATLELLYPLKRFDIVQNQTTASTLDPYLVLSLIRQESAFNDRARSQAGAVGLMQLLPKTARRFERVTKQQLYDPRTNVRVGTKFFERLVNRFGGDVELALAAYNAGPERVEEWRRRYPINNRLLFLDLIPFRETRDYVASIARNYYWYLRLYSSENLKSRILAEESNKAVLKIFGMPEVGSGESRGI